MHLDAGAVQRHCLDLDLHDLRLLQLLESAIKYTGLCPATHARVDRVPIAEPLGQTTPLASMFGDVQDRVKHLQIRQADVAALLGQAVFYLGKLSGRDLHSLSVDEDQCPGN